MKKVTHKILITVLLAASSLFIIACPEEGESGSAAIDCGELGAEHDGHCHCNEGALFDGETCVAAADITDICAEEDHSEDTEDTDHTADEHVHEAACLCPVTGDCLCDHGEIIETGGASFCTPELHEE